METTSIFATFADYIAGTMSQDEAMAYVKQNPGWQAYTLLKYDATGKGVTRFAVRPKGALVSDGRKPTEFEGVETVRQRMDRIAATPKAPKAKEERVEKNGVKHPSSTSMGAKVWAMFDDLWSIRKEPFTRSAMLAEATNRQFNPGNVATELGLWKRYHGRHWKFDK